ncbi:cytochrome c, partial [bacterium]|nr:cytochrome c [bacterium]
DQTGGGKGIVVQRGYLPPPSFHIDRLRDAPDGHIFGVITHGIRNMPGYAQQVSVEDRWHIVNYLRALQRSQNASLEDIPANKRSDIVAK